MQEYTIDRDANKSKKLQTYQFMKGKYRSADRMDPSMEKVAFEEIATDLALQLRKQNLYALEEPGQSDLLIVVHYGATWPPVPFYDSSDIQQMISMNALDNIDNNLRKKLLGMEVSDHYGKWPSEQRLLGYLSGEGRYYIILMAYDFPLLQKGEAKLVWRTRYSIRALGQPFETAVHHMNRIASDYISKNMEGLINKRVDDSSHVAIGEIEVIEAEGKVDNQINYYQIPQTIEEFDGTEAIPDALN